MYLKHLILNIKLIIKDDLLNLKKILSILHPPYC